MELGLLQSCLAILIIYRASGYRRHEDKQMLCLHDWLTNGRQKTRRAAAAATDVDGSDSETKISCYRNSDKSFIISEEL